MRNKMIEYHAAVVQVLVCGQAMSHTVNYTLQDLTHHWPGDKKRLVLLKDGKSCSCDYCG